MANCQDGAELGRTGCRPSGLLRAHGHRLLGRAAVPPLPHGQVCGLSCAQRGPWGPGHSRSPFCSLPSTTKQLPVLGWGGLGVCLPPRLAVGREGTWDLGG